MKLCIVTNDGEAFDVTDEDDDLIGWDFTKPFARSSICDSIDNLIKYLVKEGKQ